MLLSHLNIQLTRGSHYIAIYAFWIHRFDFIWPNSRMHTHTHTQNGYDRPIARIGQILAKEILISMQKCSINEQQYLPLSKLPSKFHAIAGAVDFRGFVYGIHQWIHSIGLAKPRSRHFQAYNYSIYATYTSYAANVYFLYLNTLRSYEACSSTIFHSRYTFLYAAAYSPIHPSFDRFFGHALVFRRKWHNSCKCCILKSSNTQYAKRMSTMSSRTESEWWVVTRITNNLDVNREEEGEKVTRDQRKWTKKEIWTATDRKRAAWEDCAYVMK